jgi:hypothetical protein
MLSIVEEGLPIGGDMWKKVRKLPVLCAAMGAIRFMVTGRRHTTA